MHLCIGGGGKLVAVRGLVVQLWLQIEPSGEIFKLIRISVELTC